MLLNSGKIVISINIINAISKFIDNLFKFNGVEQIDGLKLIVIEII